MAQGREPPNVSTTLTWLLPIELALLLATWIIDPSRNARQSDKADRHLPATSDSPEKETTLPEG
jgi:cytochrome c-type biogenesis protein CcmH/NrfF